MLKAFAGFAVHVWTLAGILAPLTVVAEEVESRAILPALPAEDRRRIDVNQDGVADFEVQHERTESFVAVRLVGFTHLLNDDPSKPILGHAKYLGQFAPGMRIATDAPLNVPEESTTVVFGEFARSIIPRDGSAPSFTSAWDSEGRLFLGVTVDTLEGRIAGYLEFRAAESPERLPQLTAVSWAAPGETGISVYPGRRQFSAVMESADLEGVVLSWPVQSGFNYLIEHSRTLQFWEEAPYKLLEQTSTRMRVLTIPKTTSSSGGYFRIKAFPAN